MKCKVCGNKYDVKIIVIISIIFTLFGILVGIIIPKNIFEENKGVKDNVNNIDSFTTSTILSTTDNKERHSEYSNFDLSKLEIKFDNNSKTRDFKLVDSYYSDDKNKLYLLLENNSEENIEYTSYINFYNSKGERIDRNIATGYLDNKNYFVIEFLNYIYTNEKIDKIDISINTQPYKSYYHKVDFVEDNFKITKLEESFLMIYENNSEHDISLELSILYFKNNKIVKFDNSYISSIKPNTSGEGKFYFYKFKDFDYKGTDSIFDDYKIIVNSVKYYDTDY